MSEFPLDFLNALRTYEPLVIVDEDGGKPPLLLFIQLINISVISVGRISLAFMGGDNPRTRASNTCSSYHLSYVRYMPNYYCPQKTSNLLRYLRIIRLLLRTRNVLYLSEFPTKNPPTHNIHNS